MIIDKVVEQEIKTDINFTGITLLSDEEYKKYRNNIPSLNKHWWLRSPGTAHNRVDYIHEDGSIDEKGGLTDHISGIRPALRFYQQDTDLEIGDKLRMAGYDWTVISNDYVLCNDTIDTSCFNKDAIPYSIDYEFSDVKNYLDTWYRKNIEKSMDIDYLGEKPLQHRNENNFQRDKKIREDFINGMSPDEMIKKYSLSFKNIEDVLNRDFFITDNPELQEFHDKIYELPLTDSNAAKIFKLLVQEGITSMAQLKEMSYNDLDSIRGISGGSILPFRNAGYLSEFYHTVGEGKILKEMEITGITLLSKGEYEYYKDEIPPVEGSWWLRSAEYKENDNTYAASVSAGEISKGGTLVTEEIGIRPVLEYRCPNHTMDDENMFKIGGHIWVPISDKTMICRDIVDSKAFNEVASPENGNIYEFSDIKKWLNVVYKDVILEDMKSYHPKPQFKLTESAYERFFGQKMQCETTPPQKDDIIKNKGLDQPSSKSEIHNNEIEDIDR